MKRVARTDKRSPRRPEAIAFAREQRQGANEFSKLVWEIVRDRRCLKQKFRREYPIPPYTVDFCCVDLKLVLEVDGKHHLTDEGREHDQRRDRFLADLGYEVHRILGYRVINEPQEVRCQIEEAITQRIAAMPPHPRPLSPKQVEGEGS